MNQVRAYSNLNASSDCASNGLRPALSAAIQSSRRRRIAWSSSFKFGKCLRILRRHRSPPPRRRHLRSRRVQPPASPDPIPYKLGCQLHRLLACRLHERGESIDAANQQTRGGLLLLRLDPASRLHGRAVRRRRGRPPARARRLPLPWRWTGDAKSSSPNEQLHSSSVRFLPATWHARKNSVPMFSSQTATSPTSALEAIQCPSGVKAMREIGPWCLTMGAVNTWCV